MLVPLRSWPRVARTLARTYGVRGLWLRSVHEGRRRLGLFRSVPRHDADLSTPADGPFRVDPDRLRAASEFDAARDRADRVVAGEYQAFRWDWRPLPATPDGWLRHPGTGKRWESGVPWWKAPHLDPVLGDIKAVWEPGRFAWAYDLVRGYLLTGEDVYARAFHDRLAQWLESSPPFQGPHWSCGQETAIRGVALLYAEANLADAPSSSSAAMERIAGVLAASGERIHDALGYALSQRNNHGLSEAMGLVVLGARFRGRHPEADRWLGRGRRWLERLIPEQFAEDGWYIQHSFNYLRVALDQCVLAQRSLEAVGRPLTGDAVRRVEAAADLIEEVMEPGTGVVPNHGHNDGALVHPISLASYRDHRPTLTAVCATVGRPLSASIRPDPEALAWLGAPMTEVGPARKDGVRTGSSGWAVARAGGAAVFLRAGRYRSRPAHVDPLHVDVRLDGGEVVVDAGTYSYNAPPFEPALPTAEAHNGPRVEGWEPALRGPRFLWLTWPEARIREANWDGGKAGIVAEVPGRVRRRVVVSGTEVRVEDRSLADAGALSVRWLLHPDADPGQVECSGGAPTVERSEGTGWFSSHYGRKMEAPVVTARVEDGQDGIVTEIGRGGSAAEGDRAEGPTAEEDA